MSGIALFVSYMCACVVDGSSISAKFLYATFPPSAGAHPPTLHIYLTEKVQFAPAMRDWECVLLA